MSSLSTAIVVLSLCPVGFRPSAAAEIGPGAEVFLAEVTADAAATLQLCIVVEHETGYMRYMYVLIEFQRCDTTESCGHIRLY